MATDDEEAGRGANGATVRFQVGAQSNAPSPNKAAFNRADPLTRRTVSVQEAGRQMSAADSDAEASTKAKALDRRRAFADLKHPQSATDMRRNRSTASVIGLNTMFDDEHMPLVAGYLHSFTIQGPVEVEQSEKKQKKANLGVLLGVYLPTIQHIFGVLMFLRLFWIVGSMGVVQSLFMVFICCLCTFLTSISMSAIATNGVVESGGSYFMISRNLGPEFGSAVGILFYLANTVATSMYLVGGVEIFLMYIVPGATVGGGDDVHSDTGMFGVMAHNFRLYATLLLIVEFAIVAAGVRFVQLFAPISLFCVVISILSVYAGALHKSIDPSSSPAVCMLGERLLQREAYMPALAAVADPCFYCSTNRSLPLAAHFCRADQNGSCDADFVQGALRCVQSMPGIGSGVLYENLGSSYIGKGEAVAGVKADKHRDVFQDLSTSFFVLLAIYFPSVTGIMTGSNMSGDLKDPQKSIPSGTLAAQLTTSFVYLSYILVFGSTVLGAVLRDKYGTSLGNGMVVAELAWPSPWVLLIGSFTSTFGAALQCLCSAPRLLQSIAKDNVIPLLAPFSVVTSKNEPFRGLIVTAVIAELAILIGAIDNIAPVVDFFFLMCYAFVNFVCALHSLLGAPNWRPRFRFYHWSLSLLGSTICFVIMFITYWYYAIVVLALCLLIYKYVEFKGAKKEWGDGMRGLAISTAQYSLLKIEDKHPHPKNFRPQLMVLAKVASDEVGERKYHNLLRLAAQLKAGRGLTVAVNLLAGEPTNDLDRDRAAAAQQALKAHMDEVKLRGFSKAVMYEENKMESTLNTLVQSVGIGGLRPNTLLVGWPYEWRNAVDQHNDQYWDFLDEIHRGAAKDMCLIVAKGVKDFPNQSDRLQGGFIDVWWVLHDGGLLVLLAFLIRQHKVWRGCVLRLFAVAQEEDNSVKMKNDLISFLYHLRIDATVEVVEFSQQEISAYAYERTMKMEERSKFIRELQLSKKQQMSIPFSFKKLSLPHLVIERTRENSATAIGKDGSPAAAAFPEFRAAREDQASRQRAATFQTPPQSPSDRLPSNSLNVQMTVGGDEGSEEDLLDAELGESNDTLGDMSSRVRANEFTFTPDALQSQLRFERERQMRKLDQKKVRKMHTAVRLNETIRRYSDESELVVLNLPLPPKTRVGLYNYMEYMDVLTANLERVLLVRGTGKEVVTIYS